MKIVADAHIPYVKNYFGAAGELVLIPGREITRSTLKNADILLVRSVTAVTEDLLINTSVKFVGSITAGFDHLDINFLNHERILWQIAQGFNAPPVADYVVCAIAALEQQSPFLFKNKRAAIIGVGQVGGLVLQRLKALNFSVICCDPLREVKENDFKSVTLADIADVDLVTIHVPLTINSPEATHHLINKNFLKRQKKDCVLLNASRGAVIHTADLLQSGQHLLWCLDVFDPEPNINKNLLQQAIIATPHIAGYSIQSKLRGIKMIYEAAVANKIIAPATISLSIPTQQLTLKNNQTWQDIVLTLFNPLTMTSMMQSLLLPARDTTLLFDQLRNEFNYRHEFAFTHVKADLAASTKEILNQLGFQDAE